MAYCANHSWIETRDHCQACKRPYCPSCLVEFLGGRLCGPCRDEQLTAVQNRMRRPVLKSTDSTAEGLSGQALMYLASVVGLLLVPMIATLAVANLAHAADLAAPGLLICAVGIGLAMVVMAIGSERLSLLGNKDRRRKVAERVAGLGAVKAPETGLFVGVSPTADRRAYQGDSSWDYGFLVVEPGWAVYYGEKTQFGLRPDQIVSMEIQPAKAKGILVDSRLLVRWYDPATGTADALRLSVPDFSTRAESRVKLAELQSLLESWMKAAPPGAGSLRLPPAGFNEGVKMKTYEWEPLHSYRQLVILVIFFGGILAWIAHSGFTANVSAFMACLAGLGAAALLSYLVDVVRLRST